MKHYETAGLAFGFFGILLGMELAIGGSDMKYYCGACILFAVSSAVLAVIFQKICKKREDAEAEKECRDKKVLELLEKIECSFGLMMSTTVLEGQTTRAERQKINETIQRCCDSLICGQEEIRQQLNQIAETEAGIGQVIISENQKLSERFGESTRDMLNVFAESTDEVMNKMAEALEREESGLLELVDNIGIVQENTMKRIQNHMGAIMEGIDEYESSIADRMEMLSNQYIQFEKFTDGVVRQMTLMSSEDTELLRGLISDNR